MHNWSYITLKLRGIKTRALLDSGSYYSILSVDLARRLRIKIEPITDETNHTLFSANGTALRLEGTANVILDIAQLRISHEVCVCSNLSEQFLLGRSFLSQAGANLNFKEGIVTFSDVLDVPLQKHVNKDTLIRAKQSVCIPANSEAILVVKIHSKFNNKDVLITPNEGEQFMRFALANSIGHVSQGQTLCRILNFQDTSLILCKDQKLGRAEIFDNSQKCFLVTDAKNTQEKTGDTSGEKVDEVTLKQFEKDYNFNINKNLSQETRMKLANFVQKKGSICTLNG